VESDDELMAAVVHLLLAASGGLWMDGSAEDEDAL
jgi:hypothetical protein